MSSAETNSLVEHDTDELGDSVRQQLLALPAVRTRLEFQFALLTAAGGLVLAAGQGTSAIAMLAVFSAVFGFVFVDWLRVFELPPVGAYLAMAGAAAYCVMDFWELQQRGEPQMVSVAMLLVLVQGVLMLQYKSRRILEQLAVFCLLELVVAAIFNDAINFGLLMIPISIVGASGLSLLALVSLMENIDVTLDPPIASEPKTRWGRFLRFLSGRGEAVKDESAIVTSSSPESVVLVYLAAGPWTRYAVFALAPAVFLVAAAFFYVLPRKVSASRSASSGPAMVGFDDKIRMEQLGQVMQNSQVAVKVRLNNVDGDAPYMLADALYLRGKVLEKYEVDFSGRRPVSQWISTDSGSLSGRSKLPPIDRRVAMDGSGEFDHVTVKITCEPMSRSSLFSIAPYHAQETTRDVVHAVGRWTLSREDQDPPFPRINYSFGTHAFTDGVQTRWISDGSRFGRQSGRLDLSLPSLFGGSPNRRRNEDPQLLAFDRSRVPTASLFAQQILDEMEPSRRTQSGVAERFEQFLSTNPQFSYTLDLSATPIPDLDPVEQFLSVDRRGHCQYFASSLALMLRSVGIPCRLVVGYRTEEYNPVGKYYIARQLHAHAWVEALIDRDQMPSDVHLAGQSPASRYWMRLDPTPGESAIDDGNREGVEGLVNMANNIWEDYVVEMDPERQNADLAEVTGLGEVQNSYKGLYGAVEQKLANLRTGRIGGGELSLETGIPLAPIAIAAATLGLLLLIRRLRWPVVEKSVQTTPTEVSVPEPEFEFYAETLRQLARTGVQRGRDETPDELCGRVGERFPALGVLTKAFVGRRYGRNETISGEQIDAALGELVLSVDGEFLPAGPQVTD